MGDYTVNLLDKLGQGSFGIVYRGKEKSSGKTVAVKEIKIKEGDQGISMFLMQKYWKFIVHLL